MNHNMMAASHGSFSAISFPRHYKEEPAEELCKKFIDIAIWFLVLYICMLS